MLIRRATAEIIQLAQSGASLDIDAGTYRFDDLLKVAGNIVAPATLTLSNSDRLTTDQIGQIARTLKGVILS